MTTKTNAANETMALSSAYTPEQVAEYLDLLNLPREFRSFQSKYGDKTAAAAAPTHDFLHALHVHQISTIPYENLSLHYSADRQVSIEPQHLFDKLVRRRRGGYCMEISIFYNHMLRALGFQVYTAGVKIRLRRGVTPFGPYAGW
jgi:hypothetical protein